MNKYRYIYNNEAIGVIAMYSIIQNIKKIEYSKAMLILPITLNDRLVKYIGNANTNIRSIEELIIKKGNLLVTFNEFYLEMLPISINSLIILKELDIIKIENGEIKLIKEGINLKANLGKRSENIIKSSRKISEILEVESETLYLQLRVII